MSNAETIPSRSFANGRHKEDSEVDLDLVEGDVPASVLDDKPIPMTFANYRAELWSIIKCVHCDISLACHCLTPAAKSQTGGPDFGFLLGDDGYWIHYHFNVRTIR